MIPDTSYDQLYTRCYFSLTIICVRSVILDAPAYGVVSLGDLVKTIISEQELTIKNLEPFVSGEY